jgi:hypothetical protein
MLVAKDKGIEIVIGLIELKVSENFHVNGKLHYLNHFIKGMESR